MTSTVYKDVNYTLSALIEDIDMGEIGLPDIQRPFVWANIKVRDLFDSMYRGYPVGYLLFWVNGAENEHKTIGASAKQKVPRLLIVDGQQRLTSLYAVLRGKPVVDSDYQERRIEIAFRPRDAVFEVADAATRRDPEFIPDISILWSEGKSSWSLVNDFLAKLGSTHVLSEVDKETIGKNIDKLFDLQKYPFTALEIFPTVDEEQVAQVFVRVNSMGTPLNQADFILTLMSVFWDEGRAQLEQFARLSRQPSASGASPYNYFIRPDPDALLRVSVGLGFRRAALRYVYSLLRGKDLETGEFSIARREAQFAILQEAQEYALDLQHWHDFFKSLVRAGYRSESMITSKGALLYSYALSLIGKRDFEVEAFRLRDVIARWFFMAHLTGRYTASPESVMEQDLARLRGLEGPDAFCSTLDQIVANNFTDDYWAINLPGDLETSSARSPALFAYYAALNLLDARVLFSKVKVSELLDPATKAKKSALERHHLFPKGHLAKQGMTETRITNQLANFALVEWADNIDISDKAPRDYFPPLSRRYTQDDLPMMLHWHALPEGWENMDYRDFLAARRKAIAGVIREGFAKLNSS